MYINTDIKSFLKKHNFSPNSLLGQNFLIDPIALDKIVEAADLKPTDEVMEIGSGIGNLTKELAQRAEKVLAIEKDQRYFPILHEELGEALQSHTKTPKSKANVQLVFADVTQYNFQEQLKPGYKVVANIPYYITGKIIEMLLAAQNRPSKIILLLQKEVAERVVAKPGSLSILAISVQLYANPKLIGLVPKESFYPQPKVDSAILSLDILPQPRLDIDEKKFFRLVKSVFAGKRKQIQNTLKNNLKVPAQDLDKILAKAGVDSKARPQELSLDQWHALYKAINL